MPTIEKVKTFCKDHERDILFGLEMTCLAIAGVAAAVTINGMHVAAVNTVVLENGEKSLAVVHKNGNYSLWSFEPAEK